MTLEAVAECIRALLPKGYPSIARTAESLGISSRTLQRRLQAAGVTYRQLVDQVRIDIARRHIEESSTKFQDIATLLGYSEPGSLSRLFVRKTGMAPRAVRRGRLRTAESGNRR